MIQGLVGLLALMLSEVPAEAQPGHYRVGSMTLEIVDQARKDRLLRTEVWYPTEDEDGTPASNYLTGVPSRALREASVAEGKWPVIVFSHGLGGVRESMTFLCEHLASHGYIVASTDHPYTTRYDVNPLRLYEAALDRPKDVSRVLDELASRSERTDDRLVGRVDTDHIGAVGSSFGAYTVLATAGAWVDYSSHPDRKHNADAPTHLDLSDARVRAVVALVPPCRPTFDQEGLSRMTRPLLILGGSEDSLTPFDTCQRPIFDWTRGERTLVRISGANHLSFQDDEILALIPESIKRMNRMNEKSIRPERLEPIVNRLVLRFLNQHVRGLSNAEPLVADSDPELDIQHAPLQTP